MSGQTRFFKFKKAQWQRHKWNEHLFCIMYAKKMSNTSNYKIISQIAELKKKQALCFDDAFSRKNRKSYFSSFQFFLCYIIGFVFSLKKMNKYANYGAFIKKNDSDTFEVLTQLLHEEKALIDSLEEERLKYMGAIVLGLNDALVELTGSLAGLTFALQDSQLIAIAGLITGISASISMGASNYLAERADKHQGMSALKSAFYTGFAYIVTVFLLILPYFLTNNYYISLLTTIGVAIVIIALFNYYYSITHNERFFARFWEMTSISISVCAVSFFIGLLLRYWLKIEV